MVFGGDLPDESAKAETQALTLKSLYHMISVKVSSKHFIQL